MIGNLIPASNKEEAGAPGRHGGLGPLLLCRVGGRGIERGMAAAAMALEQDTGAESSAVDEAVDWLRDALKSGQRPSKEVKDAANKDGIAIRTLERAKMKLDVIACPDGFGSPWVWKLPGSNNPPVSAKGNTLEDSGDIVADSETDDDWVVI